MLTWAENRTDIKHYEVYDGTFASLVRLYETHEDSPYHELSEHTQQTYTKTMALLMKHKGERRVDTVIGNDVRRWYRELKAAASAGWAYLTINVLKSVLAFGASLRIAECRILREELRSVRFHAAPRRTEQITYAQITAFVAKARELGLDWIARTLILQFEFSMRRRDVIGEYVRGVDGKPMWRDGSTWANIDKDGIYRREISKTRKTTKAVAVHAITDYPMVAEELARTPAEKRIGPLVICHLTNLPPTEAQCRHFFRLIARQVGIPDAVQNMDARAGANSEADAAGATIEERMAMSTHTTMKNSERYRRELEAASRRAARKRTAYRQQVTSAEDGE
jgi:hypothetical protein